MRHKLLCLALATVTGLAAQAQLNEGGIPLSLQSTLKDQYVPVSAYGLPDWNSAIKKSEALEAEGKQQPYLVALFTNTDVSFPSSGSFTTTANGNKVWRAQVKVDGAKAMGFYYDKFELPKGVKLYISNANGNQILGAFTSNNNAPEKRFANEAVQGSLVNIEMDIAPGVNTADINLHIDRAAIYFRSIEHLAQFAVDPTKLQEIDFLDSFFAGVSSTCMINAICPQGSAYPNQRKAVFQTLIPVGQGLGACSATMINSTGNTGATCKQYFLLATHCDGANSMTSSHFDQWLLRYNYQHATCTPGAVVPASNTMVGANFVARANYDDNAPANDIKGDFLLLEARQAVPAAWDVVLSGWNHDANMAKTVAAPKKFIGFHHPAGDVKKTSSTQEVESADLNGNPNNGTHWHMLLNSGLVAGGSSGSGLFDGDGYLIGIASVAGPVNAPQSCAVNSTGGAADNYDYVAYSKFAYDWDYSIDGSANNRKLKPWLDPTNSGVVTLNPVKSNCTAISGGGTGITGTDNTLDNSISIYPNPSATGIVNVKVNLVSATNLTMDLYDVTGKKLNSYALSNVRSGAYTIDLSQYSNGIYLLKCSDGTAVTSKKIMLSK